MGMGAQARLGMSASGAATTAFSFLSENIALDEEFVDASGIVGSRTHPGEAVRQGVRRVNGSITMNPTPVELDFLLFRILGTAELLDVFAIAETVPSFAIDIDRITRVYNYSGCYVNQATFRGSEGAPLELTIDVMGTDETVSAAGTFPAITIGLTTRPYIFSDLVLVINAVTTFCKTWELVVNNALEEQVFNSLTRTRINTTDRIITVNTQLPYDVQTAYGLAVAGVAATATFTNGLVSILFNTPNVQFPRKSPVVGGSRGEIMLNVTGVARGTGTTDELTVTSDSTP